MQDWNQARRDLKTGMKRLKSLSPETMKGIAILSGAGAATNLLDAKTRELIALAIAVTTRCDGCIAVHAAEAKKLGVTAEEVAEAVGVAVLMNAGAALVYGTHVLDALEEASI